jgi:hypothetical protein
MYLCSAPQNDRLGEQLKSNFEGLRIQMKEGKVVFAIGGFEAKWAR